MNGIQKAIEIAGSQEKLGAMIGASQQKISYWLKTGKVAPEFVLPIETKTNVSRHVLRPDLYPVETAA